MIDLVTDTFPRQQARTQRFTLGVPRSFQVSPDGGRAAFLVGPARVRDLGALALDTLTPAADPRPDPAGRLVAYVHAGALRVIDLASGQDTAVAAPGQGEEEVTFGLAEFVAAEEMGRHRGYWWAPDGTALGVPAAGSAR
jgi:dipeptidyl-peptidase-4